MEVRHGIPWGSGEKDWRMLGRGGREEAERRSVRSSEGRMHTCGLSDRGRTDMG